MTPDTFCLHTDKHQYVWTTGLDGIPRPISSDLAITRPSTGIYWVIAKPINYELIVKLAAGINEYNGKSAVFLGAPRFAKSECVREVLHSMTVVPVHQRMFGSWIRMQALDYVNYTFLWQKEKRKSGEILRSLFVKHPAYRAFKFVGIESREFVYELLATIVDPRWFINPAKSNRTSRIESYFGLNVSQFRRLWLVYRSGREPKTPLEKRAMLLIHVAKAAANTQFMRWFVTGQLDGTWKNLRRGCLVFLRFLVRNWLSALTCNQYFDPEVFFKTCPAEARKRFNSFWVGHA